MQIDISTQKITAIKAHRDWVEATFGFRTGLKQSKEAVELLAAEKAEQDTRELKRRHCVEVAERVYRLLWNEGLAGTDTGTDTDQFPTAEAVFARLFPD